MRFLLQTRNDTIKWGRAFGALLQSADVIALSGDLGSGKTTLTQAIAAGMGITDSVTSPTFSLIQEYGGRIPLYHFDPYRLDRPEEISELGLDEYLQADGVIVVEWADLIEELLPQDRFSIRIEILSSEVTNVDAVNSPRRITVDGLGPRSLAIVAQLSGVTNAPVSEIEANNAR